MSIRDKEQVRQMSPAYQFFYWDTEHYQTIEHVLNIELSDETKRDLETQHRNFAANLNIDISRLSRTRKWLKSFIEAVDKFEKLGDPDDRTEQALALALPYSTKCPSIDDAKRDLLKLRNRAKIALTKLPPKDRPGPNQREWPMRTLITELKRIYEHTTDKKARLTKAKRSKNKEHNEPGGPFFNFVMAFLQIIGHKPHSDFAVMGIIEEVIYQPNSLRNIEIS